MPTPRKGEKQGDFMSRCVPDVIDEGKEQDQAVAICLSVWRNRGKKEKAATGMTSKDDAHSHRFNVDEKGTGKTTLTFPPSEEPHVHKVVEWEVQEADGHTHTIKESERSHIEISIREEIEGNKISSIYAWDGVYAVYDRAQAAFISFIFDNDFDEEEASQWVVDYSGALDYIVEVAHKIYDERGDS